MKRQNITTFEEAVDYLYSTPKFTTKNSIEDTQAYLHKMGDPDNKLRIIHVAGTNGKGSVCAYLRYILMEAGYRVASFTSPHLVDVRERFLVDGEMITKEAFLEAFLEIYNSLDWESLEQGAGYHPTFFEYLFFMAMLIFPKENVDFCILETGLGGRLDATNAISQKELSVITRISLDHVEYLGNTIEQIASEKAGIIHAGTPVVFTNAQEEATRVILRQAAKCGVSDYAVSKRDYTFLKIHNKNIAFSLHSEYYGYIRLSLRTIARYQMENAALAVRAIEVLDRAQTITEEHIIRGVEKCVWQGRMEEVLPEVYVDGAHNEDGIRAFLDTVSEDGCEGSRTLLFSVVSDKDYEHMIEKLACSGLFEHIAVAHMHTGRATTLEKMSELFARYPQVNYSLHEDVKEAFQELLDSQKQGERIYVAGSLYLVGEIKESLKDD